MGGWNRLKLWRSMGTLCHGVVIVVAIMFVWSMSVSAGRAFGFHLAREQSAASIAETIEPPPEGKLDRATVLAERLAENGPSARLGT